MFDYLEKGHPCALEFNGLVFFMRDCLLIMYNPPITFLAYMNRSQLSRAGWITEFYDLWLFK